MSKTILLFDMDGVLLEPGGYHRALVETVRLTSEMLGYTAAELTPADIAAFEAAGITSEWDSSAICLVWLMLPLWERFPSLGIPATLTDGLPPGESGLAPGWDSLFGMLNHSPSESVDPVLRAEQLLAAGHPRERAIRHILRNSQSIGKSLTHRIFQELVLGSSIFAETYSLPPCLDVESYLLQFDRPNLTPERREALLHWLADDQHRAAIFTNRPSRHGKWSTPEAEIGARCVGLNTLPMVGYGDLLWLSDRSSLDVRKLRKPSPVHVLAALMRSCGADTEAALQSAVNLAFDGHVGLEWDQFRGAEIYVFEDTRAGLKSAQAASEILRECSLEISWHLIGISAMHVKQAVLRQLGADVYSSFEKALTSSLVRG